MNRTRIQVGWTVWTLFLAFAAALGPAWAQPGQATPADQGTTTALEQTEPERADQLRFNFQGVPLDTVLQYLSRAAGFVVVNEAGASGRVNVISEQPMTPDEAVELLDTVLNGMGYAAIRSGRNLTIVKRGDARTRDIPVRRGNDPNLIVKSDQIITQIIPVRHATAKDLVTNLKDLLPSTAVISANERSNSILLTDTQTDVRRIVEIVQALDQSMTDISTVRVFRLSYADAKATADMLNSLFKAPTTSSSNNSPRRFFRPFGRGSSDNSSSDNGVGAASEVTQAAVTVTAASDERTNSVVVSAPDEMMPTISKLIEQLDTSGDVITEVRVFPLKYADATQMAQLLTDTFGQNNSTSNQSGNNRFRFGGRRGGFFARMQQQNANQGLSTRQQQANTVLAVADTRTNSVVVSAIGDTMDQIAQVVDRLDKSSAKTKTVYVYNVQNADPADVADTLQQMFGSTTSSSRSSSNRNSSRNSSSNQNSSSSNRNSSSSNRNSSSGMGSLSR